MSDSRFCLALDVPDAQRAAEWVRRTTAVFGVYKIGLELFCAEGPKVVDAVRRAGAGRIFLDLKLHDIPRTVAGAVSRIANLGVDYLTIHTAGGGEMMASAQDAAQGQIQLLGVTVLTSLNQDGLNRIGMDMEQTLAQAVTKRGQLAISNGISGLVCSALEVEELRTTLGAQPILVTPGIRFADQAAGDQKRVVTPADALRSGSSMLVLGRAITAANDLDDRLRRLREAAQQ